MKTEQYLAVSALSYKNLEAYVGYTIGKLYSPDGPLDNDFMNKIENKALKDLSSWVLINIRTSPPLDYLLLFFRTQKPRN